MAELDGPAVPESWYIPRALSNEALRLLTTLPMDEIERRLLASIPAPIPVSERLPGPEDCQPWPGEPDETHWCWVFVKGSLGDDAWERRPVTCLTAYRSIHTHWLPAHALPLPEAQ